MRACKTGAVAALMLSMSGCTVTSRVPLVTEPSQVPGLVDGAYQRYAAVDPKELRKVPRKIRPSCLAPGYSFHIADNDAGSAGRTIAPLYCPYSGEKVFPLMHFVQAGGAYRVRGLADRADKVSSVQFQRLREGVFLAQFPKDEEAEGFDYALIHPVASGFDVSLLSCNDFPSIAPKPESIEVGPSADGDAIVAKAQNAKGTGPGGAAQTTEYALPAAPPGCEAPSLAAIRPELDVVAARVASGDEPVLFLLRRVASAGAPTGRPPR
jgi:hypothetical protein